MGPATRAPQVKAVAPQPARSLQGEAGARLRHARMLRRPPPLGQRKGSGSEGAGRTCATSKSLMSQRRRCSSRCRMPLRVGWVRSTYDVCVQRGGWGRGGTLELAGEARHVAWVCNGGCQAGRCLARSAPAATQHQALGAAPGPPAPCRALGA